eukprot:GHVL01044667.1.p1 GENE.GHVL01044667.1~~GHVL01044667.1.p1  ORF type:complete len:566 (+),score=128.89 GHVL01044667.1:263-1960(+)
MPCHHIIQFTYMICNANSLSTSHIRIIIYPKEDFYCLDCNYGDFADISQYRSHVQGEWHQVNSLRKEPYSYSEWINRNENSIPPSDEEEEEEESSSDSSASINLNSEINKNSEINVLWKDQVLRFHRRLIQKNKEIFENPLKLLKKTLKSRRWCIIVFRSGRFSAALTDGAKILKTKTFKKYTIRAKSGKSQSSFDAADGKARSGGASMRREMEKKLNFDIQDLLQEWESDLRVCDRIYFSVSKHLLSVVFGKILDRKDERLYIFPISVSKPTISDLLETYRKLTIIMCDPISDNQLKIKNETDNLAVTDVSDNLAVTEDHPTVSIDIPSKSSEIILENVNSPVTAEQKEQLTIFWEACLSGNESIILDFLSDESNVSLLNQRDENGFTSLHSACIGGNSKIVQILLKNGANPTLKDYRNRVPYHLVSKKDTRELFRRLRGENEDMWDWKSASVPEPITEESEAKRLEKQREKRRATKQRKKDNKNIKTRDEKPDMTSDGSFGEARVCDNCKCSAKCSFSRYFYLKKPLSSHFRLDFNYCSSECVQLHKRTLMADAAIKRSTIRK